METNVIVRPGAAVVCSNMETVLSVEFVTARSRRPSPLNEGRLGTDDSKVARDAGGPEGV